MESTFIGILYVFINHSYKVEMRKVFLNLAK